MNTVYLSLGTNIGNKRKNLKNAIKLLKKNNIKILKISSVYKTEPVGFKNQPYFYNICIKAKTHYSTLHLLKKIKKTEKELGRIDCVKWGPRIIDIDILFYNNIILNKKNLKIPHKEIVKRKFVLIPLNEIDSKIYHPIKKLTINELLKKSKLKERIKKIGVLND